MIDVVMPQMGESIVEGTLTRWLKKPGDKVERDEPLFEISTDKVDTEIPSPAAGVLSELWCKKAARLRSIRWWRASASGARTQPAQKAEAAAPAAAPPQQAGPSVSTPPSVAVGPSAAAPEARTPAPAPPPTHHEPVAAVGWALSDRAASSCRSGASTACSHTAARRPRGARAAIAAGPQDGSRVQHRFVPGEGNRRGRPHHEAGHRRRTCPRRRREPTRPHPQRRRPSSPRSRNPPHRQHQLRHRRQPLCRWRNPPRSEPNP